MTIAKKPGGATPTPKEVPVEVEVKNEDPLLVEVVEEKNGKAAIPISKAASLTLPPRTTEQQDVVSAGQRKTAWLWERTQSITAIVVTTIAVLVLAWLSVSPTEPTSNQLVAALQLNVMATLILANYFSRTNHSKGGSSVDTDDDYKGR